MSSCTAWCSACMVAMVFCATLEPSHSQGCSTEETKNATVDLQVALSRGIRGADPVHVASWEACINICCFGQSISGNKKCNLVVFKPQKRGLSPNCYLFHCPTDEACPLKQAVGLVTFRTIKDAAVPKPTSPLNKSSDFIANGSIASLKALVIDASGTTTSPNWLGPSPKISTLKVMEILLGQREKPADKIDRHSHHPGGERANTSANSDPLPTHQTISLMTTTNTPQTLVPIIQPTVKLPAVTPSNQTRSVATVPPSNATSTRHATADYETTYVATVSPRRSSPGTTYVATVSPSRSSPGTKYAATVNSRSSSLAPQPTATSQMKASSLNPLSPSLSVKVSSAALHKARLSHGQLSKDSNSLNRDPSEKQALDLGDRSVLVAVLLFGVIFLLLAQVVIGRKLLESLRHRQYSRLDYLINGMYTNV